MGKKYQNDKLDTSQPAVPEQVSVALAELVGEVREGLLALAVGTGMQVMTAMMEADVTAACGIKGRHDPERTATRHGHEAGSVSLGGRRVPVARPRMRATDGSGELPVATYELFSQTDVLGRMAMERMLAGLSTRCYPVGLEPVGARVEQATTATSKSAVSRRFVAATETALAELLAAELSGRDLVALMVDGVPRPDRAKRPSPAGNPGLRTGPHSPRRRRIPARRPGRDADRAAPGCTAHPCQILAIDQLRRELDRDLSGPFPQRQTLAERTDRRPALADLDPNTGRARLSYRRAAEVFKDASNGWTPHQLRHSRLTHLAEAGLQLPMLMTKSRHTSLTSLAIYAKPTFDAVAAATAAIDPARRR